MSHFYTLIYNQTVDASCDCPDPLKHVLSELFFWIWMELVNPLQTGCNKTLNLAWAVKALAYKKGVLRVSLKLGLAVEAVWSLFMFWWGFWLNFLYPKLPKLFIKCYKSQMFVVLPVFEKTSPDFPSAQGRVDTCLNFFVISGILVLNFKKFYYYWKHASFSLFFSFCLTKLRI